VPLGRYAITRRQGPLGGRALQERAVLYLVTFYKSNTKFLAGRSELDEPKSARSSSAKFAIPRLADSFQFVKEITSKKLRVRVTSLAIR
jgi:hypothetical protein